MAGQELTGITCSEFVPTRVMVVDDSAIVRGLMIRHLEGDPEINIISSVGNGQMALNALERHETDVIILDLDMPVMDGLTAIPKLIQKNPLVRIIVASSLTTANAEISFKALGLGAVDFIPKPSPQNGFQSLGEFHHELLEKIKTHGRAKQAESGKQKAQPKQTETLAKSSIPILKQSPQLLVIGCSTGGPQALLCLLPTISPAFQAPIVVVQHMPPIFTEVMAAHLQKVTKRPCAEARHGEVLEKGHIYVAPGGQHLILEKNRGGCSAKLLSDALGYISCPAVDLLFSSAAQIYGPTLLALVLTGMGQDGVIGAQEVVRHKGTVFVQDQESSLIWGMPGAVVGANLHPEIMTLNQMTEALNESVKPKSGKTK